MILGVIQISGRVTRLRVSDVGGETSRRLLDRSSLVTAELANSDRLTALLMAEIEAARDAGATAVEVVAGRSLRGTRLLRLLDRVSRASGVGSIHVPGAADRLAESFIAVTRPRRAILDGPVAVARIGDTSTGIATGLPGDRPQWVGSRSLGAATLTERAGFNDPPRPNQIEAAINGASRAVESLALPGCGRVFLDTPVAAVLDRLCGPRIDASGARRGLDAILGQTADDTAAWFGAETGRARMLPATLVIVLTLARLTGAAVEPCAADPVAGRAWLAHSRLVSGREQRAA